MNTLPDYDLQSTIELFDDYLARVHAKHPKEIHSDLAYEASERLRQMQFFLQRISATVEHLQNDRTLSAADLQLRFETPASTPEDTNTGNHLKRGMFVVRAYTESFYYLAFRFKKILSTKTAKTGGRTIPFLDAFDPVGVRTVRNQLLEHPDGKDSQVYTQTFDLGTQAGPRLKVHSNGDPVPAVSDKGIFLNAAEFKVMLEALLKRVIAEKLQ